MSKPSCTCVYICKIKCKEQILPQQNKILLARRTANENIRIFISTYSKIVLVLILRDKQNCVANQAVALCGANCLKNNDCPSGRQVFLNKTRSYRPEGQAKNIHVQKFQNSASLKRNKQQCVSNDAVTSSGTNCLK